MAAIGLLKCQRLAISSAEITDGGFKLWKAMPKLNHLELPGLDVGGDASVNSRRKIPLAR